MNILESLDNRIRDIQLLIGEPPNALDITNAEKETFLEEMGVSWMDRRGIQLISYRDVPLVIRMEEGSE